MKIFVNLFLFLSTFSSQVLQQAVATLREKCFIISREKDRPEPKNYADKYDIISIQDTGEEYIVLFRQRIGAKPAKFVKIVTFDESFAWIDKVNNISHHLTLMKSGNIEIIQDICLLHFGICTRLNTIPKIFF